MKDNNYICDRIVLFAIGLVKRAHPQNILHIVSGNVSKWQLFCHFY